MSLYRRIELAASTVQPRVVLQTAVLAPFYVITWLLGFLARFVWGLLVRVWLGLRIGFTDGWSGTWAL